MSSIIKRKYTDVMDVVSSSSGLYIIVEIKTGRSEAEVVEKINAAGIKATSFSHYVRGLKRKQRPMFMLYFFNLDIERFEEIMEVIADIIR